MGPSHSIQQPKMEHIIINHPKFKDIKLIKEDDTIQSLINIQHESDYEQWQQKLNKITTLDDEVILLPKAYQYSRKAICGSSGTIQINYDNYPYVLADELKNREKCNKYFSQSEIWYLLYSLVSAAHDFQKINSKIGDVRPDNIFINEEGYVKVSNLYSWPGEISNYIKTVYDNEKTYLAPQEAQAAKQGQNQTNLNKFKAESFSIGLTVLQSAMIRPFGYLYRQDKTFDAQNFTKLLKQWWNLTFVYINQQTKQPIQKQYSNALKLTIAALCQIQAQDRLISDEVYKWLKDFHKEINELIPFEPGLPPIKNIQKYIQYLKTQTLNKPIGKIQTNNGITINNVVNNPYQVVFNKYANPEENVVNINSKPNIQTPNFTSIQGSSNFYPPPTQNFFLPSQNISAMPTQTRPYTLAIPTTSTYIPNTTQSNTLNTFNMKSNFSQPSYQPPTLSQQPQFILNQPYNPSSQNYSQIKTNLPNYPISKPSGVGSSDFLRQIDEQLARSRQGFK